MLVFLCVNKLQRTHAIPNQFSGWANTGCSSPVSLLSAAWHCSSPTSESVLGDLDHLRAVDLEADDLQVLEDEVGEGADEAVVDKQVLDDRVAAGVRPERLRQQREVDRLALNGKSLGLGVEVAETGRLEVGGRRVLRPGTLTGNAGNAA